LTKEDLIIRQHILNLMCRFETEWNHTEAHFPELPAVLTELSEMENDGLLHIENNKLIITEAGKPFLRNACMAFDLRLKRRIPETQVFSLVV